MIRRAVEASGRSCVFSLAQRNNGPEIWRDLRQYSADAMGDGVNIRAVVPPRAIGLLPGLDGSQYPFSVDASYRQIAHLLVACSEERGVGKECVSTGKSRWSRNHTKHKGE